MTFTRSGIRILVTFLFLTNCLTLPASAASVTSSHKSKLARRPISARRVFAYSVPFNPDDRIFQFRWDGTCLFPLSPPTVPSDSSVVALLADSLNRFVLSLNVSGTAKVFQYMTGGTNESLKPAHQLKFDLENVEQFVETDNGRYLYMATGDGHILQFRILHDGEITPLKPATVASGWHPRAMLISPLDNALYVLVDNVSNPEGYAATIDQYRIQKDGTLASLNPVDAYAKMTFPDSIAMNKDGKYLYATSNNGLSTFAVSKDGSLTDETNYPPCEGCPDIDQSRPTHSVGDVQDNHPLHSITFSHSGRFAYALEEFKDITQLYSILNEYVIDKSDCLKLKNQHVMEANSGSLDDMALGLMSSPEELSSGDSLTFDPLDRYLFVSSASSKQIYQYSLDDKGNINGKEPAQIYQNIQSMQLAFLTVMPAKSRGKQ